MEIKKILVFKYFFLSQNILIYISFLKYITSLNLRMFVLQFQIKFFSGLAENIYM